MLKNYRKKNGFTLIELMIVVCILGILASIVIHQFAKYKERTKDKSHTSIEISIKPGPIVTVKKQPKETTEQEYNSNPYGDGEGKY